MCGIIAVVSLNKNCGNYLYDGLEQLKNRGYDSAGICTYNEQFLLHKYASCKNEDAYDKLKTILVNHNNSYTGIGHTRWATHGAKTDINSHPHISMNGKFVLVHNGIIENYKAIKNMLQKNGYTFKSQTDSEVIVNLLEFFYKKNNNILECIKLINIELEGTWGLAIMCIDDKSSIYCTRHGSPLLIGYDDQIGMVVSEKNGFCNKISNYFVLNNQDICKISLNNSEVSVITNHNYETKKMNKLFFDISPEPFLHWTLKEIYSQKDACLRAISMGGRLLNNGEVKLGGLDSNSEKLLQMNHIILLGCGTSYFAGMYVMHTFKELGCFETVQLFDGAEFGKNDIPRNGNTLLILISQSGETKDLHRCIKIGNEENLFLLGVVNVVDSLIAREVNCGCYLNAGREMGVASTKSYTSQIVVLTMIALWFSQKKNTNELKRIQIINDMRNLPNDIEKTLELSDLKINDMLEIFTNISNCFVLGKYKSESVAKEAALKIKEISYIHSEGYSTSSLKHGPFALLDEKFPVIIIAPENEYYSKAENAYEEIKSRYAPVIFISNKENIDKENVIWIPKNNSFEDLLCILPLQLLAYKLSVSKGINPDVPRNLAKVVTVE
jgi:glucosamine--fructose-6-phosphate aminotransferase (isomerizing)